MFGLPSPWVLLIAGGAIVGAAGTGFITGKNYQYRIDAVASLKAEIATLRFDADISKRKASEAEAARVLIEAADDANQEKIDALTASLAARPECRADDAGIKRLLDIR